MQQGHVFLVLFGFGSRLRLLVLSQQLDGNEKRRFVFSQ